MKPESLKVMQKLIESAHYNCKDENYVEYLKGEFARIVRIETPAFTNTKFNWYDYVANDDMRPVMCGVFCTEGLKVASDSHILIFKKESYPEDWEGKVIGKDGTFKEGKYPNFKAIVPNVKDKKSLVKYTEYEINFKQVNEFVDEVKAAAKVEGTRTPLDFSFVEVGKCRFKLSLFIKLVSFMKEIGSTTLWTGYEEIPVMKENPLTFQMEPTGDVRISPRVALTANGEDKGLLMPMMPEYSSAVVNKVLVLC